MAIYKAYVAADTVGSTDQLPFFSAYYYLDGDTARVEYSPSSYMNVDTDSAVVTLNAIQEYGWAGQPHSTWEAQPGQTYSMATLQAILGISGGFGNQGTSQDLNQFLFAMNDRFHGSNEGDMLCGWEGNDRFLLGKGEDYCYFADGQDKDFFKKFNHKKDTVVLDTDVVGKLKDANIKYKHNKAVLKFGDGDKVTMKGKKAPDDFGQVKDCVDIQDWYV